jgi:hypothetical protein
MSRPRGLSSRASALTAAQKLLGHATAIWQLATRTGTALRDDEIVAVAMLRSHAKKMVSLFERPDNA